MRKGIYFDTANPHHAVRLIEGGDGRKDLLLVSGEEHDQGIKPEEYADYFGRWNPSYICLCPGLGQVLCVFAVACFFISYDCNASVAIIQLLNSLFARFWSQSSMQASPQKPCCHSSCFYAMKWSLGLIPFSY